MSGRPLTVWIVQPGEPLPIDQHDLRLWRSGTLARTLRDRGHKVVWWASTFRHMDHTFRARSETHVDWNGITLALVHSPGYQRNVSLRRIVDHHVLGKNMAAAAERQPPPDVIHCGYPPLETCESMVDYSARHRVPIVVDIRDMWPDAFIDAVPGILRPFARPVLGALGRRAAAALRKATAIHGHAPRFRDYGLERAGRPAGPLDRWFPFGYQDTQPSAGAVAAAEVFWDGQGVRAADEALTICFLGNLNTERAEIDHETVPKAVGLARARGLNVRAVYCGAGRVADRLRREYDPESGGLLIPGYMNAAQMWVLMRRSHLGLLPYLPSRDFVDSLPNKSIEYLSGGLPVLTSLTRGYLYERFSEAECLITYPAGDPTTLSQILQGLVLDRGRRQGLSAHAAALFEREFRAETVYGALADFLEQLARDPRAAGANLQPSN